jgi:hypothetical protein
MVLAVVGFSSFALGQKDTGAIARTVRDPGGAVLSGAKISVVDADRGTAVGLTSRFEFPAQFFNAFKHLNPQFSNPNNIQENIATENGSPGFGFAQAARDPRFIQVALKFYF